MGHLLFFITHKSLPIEREGFGFLVFVKKRLPFRAFSSEGDKSRVFYKPSFAGAGFHEIDFDNLDFSEFLDLPDAFSAMAYLRKNDLVLDKSQDKA